MSNIRTMVERMSDYLDAGRPGVKSITLKARRRTVMRYFEAKWRGGPIEYRGRELVTLDPVNCPQPPKRLESRKCVPS